MSPIKFPNITEHQSQLKVTVVIATIGNMSILETVKSLEKSSLKPDEIIVVIPECNKNLIPKLDHLGVQITSTPFFGQVKQRNYGVDIAKNNTILQLDDDVILDRDCIKNLVDAHESFGINSAVGPQFKYFSGDLVSPIRSFFYQMFSSLFWGSKKGASRFGTINGVGCGHGVDFSVQNTDFLRVDWLSGGCVLQNRSSRLDELHFPFEGKAYCEDLMQSLIQTKKNSVAHFCIASAICWIKKEDLNCSNYNLNADYRAREHVLRLMGKGRIRLNIWYLLKKVSWLLK